MTSQFVPISPRQIRRRRIKVFGLMFISTLFATLKWITVIPSDSSLFTRFLMIGLFILTFAWIALFFWSSIFGFFELLRKKKVPGRKNAAFDPHRNSDAGLQRISGQRFCQFAGNGTGSGKNRTGCRL